MEDYKQINEDFKSEGWDLKPTTFDRTPVMDQDLPYLNTGFKPVVEDMIKMQTPEERKVKIDNMISDISGSIELSDTQKMSGAGGFINSVLGDPVFKKSTEVSGRDAYGSSLHSGAALPRTKVYFHGLDSEDVLAKNQSTWDKIYNGTAKFLAKSALYGVGGFMKPYDLLLNSTIKESLAGGINTELSRTMQDIEDRLNYSLPNYYEKEKRNYGFLKSVTGDTANFVTDHLLGGVSFVIGAVISEVPYAIATGGASVPLFFAKTGAKMGAKTALKSSVSAVGRTGYTFGRKAAQEIGESMVRGSNIGRALNTARFVATSVPHEASIEAMGFRKEAEADYITSYESYHGRRPSYSELKEFRASLDSGSNAVFAANAAILSVSNVATIGSLFGIVGDFGGVVGKTRDRFLGLGFTRAKANPLVWTTKTQTKMQKALSKTSPVFGGILVEGFWEEGQQGAFSGAAKSYMDSRFNPYNVGKTLSVLESYKEGLEQSYGSASGSLEIGIGGIIGAAFGVRSAMRASGRRSSEVNTALKSQANATKMTNSVINTMSRIHAFNGTHAASGKLHYMYESDIESAVKESGLTDPKEIKKFKEKLSREGGFAAEALSSLDDLIFERLNIDYTVDGLGTTEANFNNFIDAMSAEDSGFDSSDAEAFGKYKNEVKSRFAKRLSDFKAANNIASSMTSSIGHAPIFRGYMAKNIYDGIVAYDEMKNIGTEMANLIGGLTSIPEAMEALASINEEDAAALDEIMKIREDLLGLESEIEKLNVKSSQEKEGESYSDEINKMALRHDELVKKRERLKSEISSLIKISKFDLSRLYNMHEGEIDLSMSDPDMPIDIEEVLEGLLSIREFESSLESVKGRNRVFETYLNLSDQYKSSVYKLRGARDFMNHMMDPKFMRNEHREFIKMLSSFSDDKAQVEDYDDVEFSSLSGRSDVALKEAYESGKISEDEYYTYKAYNHLMWKAKRVEAKKQEEDSETLSDEAMYDILNSYPSEASPLASAQEFVERFNKEINDVVYRIQNDVKLTPNQQRIMDTVVWFYEAVNERLRNDTISIDDLVESMRETLKEVKESNINDIVDDMDKSLEESLGEDAAILDEIRDIVDKVMSNTASLDDIARLRKLSTEEGVPNYVEAVLVKAEESLDYEKVVDPVGRTEASSMESLSEDRYDESSFFESGDQWNNDSGGLKTGSKTSMSMTKNTVDNTYAMTRKIKDGFTIHGISPEHFIALIKGSGAVFENGVIKIPVEGGHVELPVDQNTNIIMIPNAHVPMVSGYGLVFGDIATTPMSLYSMLYKVNEDGSLNPVYGSSEFNGERIDEDAVRKLKKGDAVSVSFEPNDPFNKKLIDEYNNAKDEKSKKKASDNLVASLVFKVRDRNGNLVAVFAGAKKMINLKRLTESQRNLIGQRFGLVDKLLKNTSGGLVLENNNADHTIVLIEDAEVDHVISGRLNFSFVKTENGVSKTVFNYSSKPKNVVGFGFIKDGVLHERGQKTPDVGRSRLFPWASKAASTSTITTPIVPVVFVKMENGDVKAIPVSTKKYSEVNDTSDLDRILNKVLNNEAVTEDEVMFVRSVALSVRIPFINTDVTAEQMLGIIDSILDSRVSPEYWMSEEVSDNEISNSIVSDVDLNSDRFSLAPRIHIALPNTNIQDAEVEVDVVDGAEESEVVDVVKETVNDLTGKDKSENKEEGKDVEVEKPEPAPTDPIEFDDGSEILAMDTEFNELNKEFSSVLNSPVMSKSGILEDFVKATNDYLSAVGIEAKRKALDSYKQMIAKAVEEYKSENVKSTASAINTATGLSPLDPYVVEVFESIDDALVNAESIGYKSSALADLKTKLNEIKPIIDKNNKVSSSDINVLADLLNALEQDMFSFQMEKNKSDFSKAMKDSNKGSVMPSDELTDIIGEAEAAISKAEETGLVMRAIIAGKKIGKLIDYLKEAVSKKMGRYHNAVPDDIFSGFFDKNGRNVPRHEVIQDVLEARALSGLTGSSVSDVMPEYLRESDAVSDLIEMSKGYAVVEVFSGGHPIGQQVVSLADIPVVNKYKGVSIIYEKDLSATVPDGYHYIGNGFYAKIKQEGEKAVRKSAVKMAEAIHEGMVTKEVMAMLVMSGENVRFEDGVRDIDVISKALVNLANKTPDPLGFTLVLSGVKSVYKAKPSDGVLFTAIDPNFDESFSFSDVVLDELKSKLEGIATVTKGYIFLAPDVSMDIVKGLSNNLSRGAILYMAEYMFRSGDFRMMDMINNHASVERALGGKPHIVGDRFDIYLNYVNRETADTLPFSNVELDNVPNADIAETKRTIIQYAYRGNDLMMNVGESKSGGSYFVRVTPSTDIYSIGKIKAQVMGISGNRESAKKGATKPKSKKSGKNPNDLTC